MVRERERGVITLHSPGGCLAYYHHLFTTMQHQSYMFLAGQWEGGVEGSILEVPADTLIALFTLQYCQNQSINVVVVKSRVNVQTCVFRVSVESLCFGVEVKREEECPEVLCHCELPAVLTQVGEEEEEEGHKGLDKGKQRLNEENQKENGKEKEEEEEIYTRLEERKHKIGNENQKENEKKKEEGEEKEEDDRKRKVKKNLKKKTHDVLTKIKEEVNEDKDKDNIGVFKDGLWCCAGLCSSLRLAVKEITAAEREVGCAEHFASPLLGFRGGCLQACAEVSVWTKFCEMEAPAALFAAAVSADGRGEMLYPQEVLRYERHLRRPPILHNALKRTQRHIRETVQDGTKREKMCRQPLAQMPALTHQFAEGLDMTLADLMLFACFHLVLAGLTAAQITPEDITPLVAAWHTTLMQNTNIKAALTVLHGTQALLTGISRPGTPPRLVVPTVPDVSIYKSDPERSKSARGAFTKQGDVEEVVKVVKEAGVEPHYIPWSPHTSISSLFSSSSSSVPLHTLVAALSLDGHIPQSRLQRKVQQLENVCSAALALIQPGDVVVDFCSGGGHVGIPLAQCRPDCRVLLVENKSTSLVRAQQRVRQLGLTNVCFIQTNLDYFRGGFHIGVSLHACGAATDLVLRKCAAQRAAFVVSPCCYGSIRPNHVVSYPRSTLFRSLPLTMNQYLTLGHAADQTHGQDNPKTQQGQQCMRLVDEDRLQGMRQAGYKAVLALMNPPTCSPKNHILMGKPIS